MSTASEISQQTNTIAQISFSRQGQSYADNLAKALQSTPIGLNVLELAWTAGPVTFIALQIGYYIGFGKSANISLFVYFASYTLIAGVIGATAKFVFNLRSKQQATSAMHEYMDATDRLVDAYLLTRDLRTMELDDEQQSLLAAEIIMSNIFISPETLRFIINDLTHNGEFAKDAYKLLLLRHAGITTQAGQIANQIKQKFSAEIDLIEEKSVSLHKQLMQHINGNTPNLKDGIPRNEGFLERIYTAASTNSPETVSMLDAQELIGLTLELLFNREFTYFKFRFHGKKRQVDAFNYVDKLRHELLVIISGFYSRINALSSMLTDDDDEPDSPPPITSKISKDELEDVIDNQIKKIDQLCHEITAGISSQSSDRASLSDLSSNLYDLKNAISLYRKIYAQHLRLNRKLTQFEKANIRWHTLHKHSKQPAVQNIELSKQALVLDNSQTLHLAKHICQILDENKFFSRKLRRRSQHYKKLHAINLALDLAILLDETLNLSKPSLQNALQASHSAPINCLEIGNSATYKLGLGKTLCSEVKRDMTKAAEQMVKTMLLFYQIELDQHSIDKLHESYGINTSVINELKTEFADIPAVSSMLDIKLPNIKPENKIWQKTQERAIHHLKKQGFHFISSHQEKL